MILYAYLHKGERGRFCGGGKLVPKNRNTFVGRKDCPCKPLQQCAWATSLKSKSKILKKGHRIRRKVINLIQDSICDYHRKTIHCCSGEFDEPDFTPPDKVPEVPSSVSHFTHIMTKLFKYGIRD